MYSLTVLEKRRQKSRCWQDHSLRDCRQDPSLPLPASGGCQYSLASLVCNHSIPLSVSSHISSPLCVSLLFSVSPALCISYKNTCHWIWGLPRWSRWPFHLKFPNLAIPTKTLFPNRVTFTGAMHLHRDILFWGPAFNALQSKCDPCSLKGLRSQKGPDLV